MIRKSPFLLALLVALCSSALPGPVGAQWRSASVERLDEGAEAAVRLYDGTGGFLAARAAPPRWGSGLAGAGVGAAVGIAAFVLTSDGCWRKAESMCELSIPLYVGAGAAAGGLLGWVLAGRAP